nr:hypothetical protein [Nonomuraea sp. WAC 01424]
MTIDVYVGRRDRGRVKAPGVVEAFDVADGLPSWLGAGGEVEAVQAFVLERGEERFGRRVMPSRQLLRFTTLKMVW